MASVTVTREEVLAIADLARLRLSPEEVARLTEDLNGILRHMDALREPDLEGVPAIGIAAEGSAPLREDAAGADALNIPLAQLAPSFVDGFFTVPRLAALDAGAGGDDGGPAAGERAP